jgi:spoIIIJ-associated protein
MIYEFEGKNEKEAIDNAVKSLGIEREEIDVEILENKKGFLFGSGNVKIRVHINDDIEINNEKSKQEESESETEQSIKNYLKGLLDKMGIAGSVSIAGKENNRIIFNIDSDDSGILIGKKGKTLDSIQLLLNIYSGRLSDDSPRVMVDTEDYRRRRESNIIHLAKRTADQVKKSRRSVLLQAMNPFERRLVHTALNNQRNIETISEGDGLYKKIRVFYKESTM